MLTPDWLYLETTSRSDTLEFPHINEGNWMPEKHPNHTTALHQNLTDSSLEPAVQHSNNVASTNNLHALSAALPQKTINGVTLIRAADIKKLPQDLQQAFQNWMIGKTMPLIEDESWIYRHDWERFLRWYGEQS